MTRTRCFPSSSSWRLGRLPLHFRSPLLFTPPACESVLKVVQQLVQKKKTVGQHTLLATSSRALEKHKEKNVLKKAARNSCGLSFPPVFHGDSRSVPAATPIDPTHSEKKRTQKDDFGHLLALSRTCTSFSRDCLDRTGLWSADAELHPPPPPILEIRSALPSPPPPPPAGGVLSRTGPVWVPLLFLESLSALFCRLYRSSVSGK